MIKNYIVYDNRHNHDKEQNRTKQRKQMLLEKGRSIQRKSKEPVQATNCHQDEKTKRQLEQYKQKYAQIKQQLKQLETTIKQDKRTWKKLHKEQIQQVKETQKDKINTLKAEVAQLKNELNELKKGKHVLTILNEHQLSASQVIALAEQLDVANRDNNILNREIHVLQNENKLLKKEIITKDNALLKKNKTLAKKSRDDIATTLKTKALKQRIAEEQQKNYTLKSHIKVLHNKQAQLKDVQKQSLQHLSEWANLYQADRLSVFGEVYAFGYLKVIEQNVYFVEVEHAANPITVHIPEYLKGRDNYNGLPVRVVLRDDYVQLSWIYSEYELLKTKQAKVKRDKMQSRYKATIPQLSNAVQKWLRDKKILLIGSSKKCKQHTLLLTKVCQSCEWVDAYERGENDIYTKIQTRDIIFVYTDSVPHAITDMTHHYQFTTQQYYEEMYQPTYDDIIGRLTYLFWNQKL